MMSYSDDEVKSTETDGRERRTSGKIGSARSMPTRGMTKKNPSHPSHRSLQTNYSERKLSYRELHEMGSFSKKKSRKFGSPLRSPRGATAVDSNFRRRLDRLETTINGLSRKVDDIVGKMDVVVARLLAPETRAQYQEQANGGDVSLSDAKDVEQKTT